MPVPSAQKVTIAYLKTVSAVQSAGARVLTTTPPSRSAPWIRVTLLADPATDGGIADLHVEALLQIDVFAGEAKNTIGTVDDLSIAVRDALRVMNQAEHAGAVVTGAQSSRTYMPDNDEEPAMERMQMTSTIWMHS